MYAAHFGCREQPFRITPDPNFLYENDAYQEAYANLLYGIRARKGFIVLTGEVGTGKTTLLRRLMDELGDSTHFVFFYNTTLTFEDMLDFICQDLDLPLDSDAGRLQKIQALNDFLLARLAEESTGVLLIDEAQNLSDEVLENLRLLSNLETPQDKLLQIVLVGQPELEQKLAQPHLRQLKQRVIVWCRLGSLSEQEVGAFIRRRLQLAGCHRPELFTPDAVQRIAVYTKGTPRLINVLCDNALLIAYATSREQVTAAIIEEAALDLGLREGSRHLFKWQPPPPTGTEEKEWETGAATPSPQMKQPEAAPQLRNGAAQMDTAEPAHSPLFEALVKEQPVPMPINREHPGALRTPALETVRRSRSRQTRIIVIATVFLLLSLGSIVRFFFPQPYLGQRKISVPADSVSLAPQKMQPPQPSPAPIPSSHATPAPEPAPPSQTVTPAAPVEKTPLIAAPVASPPPPSSPPIERAAPENPSLAPPQKSPLQSTPPSRATKAANAVEGAALPVPSVKSSPNPSQLQDKGKASAEKPGNRPLQEAATQSVSPTPSAPPTQKKEAQDMTPVQKSPSPGKREEARLELEKRGVATSGATVLASVERGDINTLGLLLTAGASPNAKDAKGWSALMLASMRGQTAAVRALVASGADVNEKNDVGGTALMMAAIRGDQEVIQTLLANNASVNARNREGWTPLMYATWNGHTTAVRTLMAKGAEVNGQNQEGWTPLMCAAWKGDAAVVQMLLSHNANANAKNKNGDTALQLAVRRGHPEIVQLLQP